MFSVQSVVRLLPDIPTYPIEDLPEGRIVWLICGNNMFLGYRIGNVFYEKTKSGEAPYTGILSPYEWKYASDYDLSRFKGEKDG